MGLQVRAVALLSLLGLAPACHCGSAKTRVPGSDVVVAKFEHGEVTAADVQAELNRLPPLLRAKFDTATGRQELASSLIDKRLLAREAEKRGFADDPEIRRQVDALQERLVIQALLAAEQKTAGEPSAEEVQKFYDAHKQELGSAGTTADRKLVDAAIALAAPGAVSDVVETDDGYAVLKLVAKQPARVPPLEEVRSEVLNRMAPLLQRRAFDGLLARLRKDAGIEVQSAQPLNAK